MEPVLILVLLLAVAYLAVRSSRRRLEEMSRERQRGGSEPRDPDGAP